LREGRGPSGRRRLLFAFVPKRSADLTARIVMTMETIAVTITDVFEVMRLAEFAADVLELADERVDPELRNLIDRLHADLLALRPADDE
jgi:hypothetical protein